MNIAIIGFGLEGKAAYDYWKDGNEITVCDQNQATAVPEGIAARLGDDYLQNLGDFDLIVRSPFVHPKQLIEANGEAILDKVTSNSNEFLKVCPTKNVIGVTGSKGKGTTSTLIAKMLEAAGKTVHLGGNIGVPALELLENGIAPDDWVVLELSSFQLIDLKTSPHIAVCLMVVSEHMDWHEDFEEYIAAKQQLFMHQDEDDIAIYFGGEENSVSVADASMGVQIPYFEAPGATVTDGAITIDGQAICKTDKLKLLGAHNWQNACAAVTAVWQATQDVAALRQVLTSFAGLEHRLEFVAEIGSAKYYDDSFGTTPETAIVAVQAFDAPKVLILGGSDKGASYDELATVIAKSDMRQVLLIGEQAGRIQAALDAVGFVAYSPGGANMTEVVASASNVTQAGDVVLLSTACASFDMFKDYKDRGDQFKQAVRALAQAV
jgi:UDP-N-acetylmuramoylalanine--D-glutamate ligase